ncbi:MAG TPA: PDZ domain-containing protein [Lacipirellulaceae bacterium]
MKRTEFWMALALAIAAWIAAPAHPAAAQESAGAEAGAQAETQTDAGAQADAGAQTDAGAQADAGAQSTDADAQADASADTQAADQSADASASNQSSADQQSAQSDTQATGSTDTAAGETSTQATGSAEATSEAQQGQADSQRPLPAPNRQDGAAQDRDASADRDTRQDATRDRDSQQDRDMRDRDGRDSRDRDRDRRGDRRDRRDRTDFHAHIHFGAFTNGGLLINSVTHDSIFFHAGLREGDILISVNGHPVRSHADFHRHIVYEPGQRVPVVILRDGRRETVYIVYEEDMAGDVVYDDQQQPAAEAQAFLGVVFDAQNQNAAVVVAVSPGSPAEQAGLRRGDIIVALNGQEVRSYHDAIGVINSMRPGDRLGIEFSRRVDDQTQAILAGKPGPGARSATLPQREVEVRGYRGVPQDVPPAAETEIEIRRDNDNRGLLNRRPREDGRRPLIPRLRN